MSRSATRDALVAVLRTTADHNKKIADAIKKRPPAKDPGRKAYDATIMAPLYEEKAAFAAGRARRRKRCQQ